MDWTLIKKNILSNNDNLESDNYILITRANINDLVVGSHIKYIKDNKILNGGFLLKLINNDQPVNLILLLKTNIIWKLRFIKYDIYMKKPITKINIIKNTLYNEYMNEIEQRKKELDEEITSKINNIDKNNYKINIIPNK